MKQSKSAITYLMAQYRAVYKHAFLKGLVSAAILSAGLAISASASATDTFYWTSDDSNWGSGSTHSGSITSGTASRVTGLYDLDGDGTVSGGKLVIGPAQINSTPDPETQIDGVTNVKVYGGYATTSDTKDAVASNNKLIIKSGSNLSNGSAGDVNMVGGWAKATVSGFAHAKDNSVYVQAGANISGANQVIGAWASGLKGATAESNTATITGAGATDNDRLELGTAAYGALVFADNNAKSGIYTAKNNTLNLTNVKTGALRNPADTIEKTVIGGHVSTFGTGSVNQLTSLGNSLIISGSQIGNSTDTVVGNVTANYATNALSSSISSVSANGSDDSKGLVINSSTIYWATVQGGAAVNKAGGSAFANKNKVSITNSDILAANDDPASGSAIIGGSVSSEKSATGSMELEASENTVSIENTNVQSAKKIVGSVIGAKIEVEGTDLSSTTLTANDNQVTLSDGITLSGGSVFGVQLDIAANGAEVEAKNNSVSIAGEVTGNAAGYDGSGFISAVSSTEAGTFINNHTSINGEVSNGLIVAAQGGSQAPTNLTLSTFTDNSVTIESSGEVTSSDIYAAMSDSFDALALNNDVTIKGKVTDSDIYGGAGANSLVSLESSSILTYNSDTPSQENYITSDTVKLAGALSVSAKDGLTIRGFYSKPLATRMKSSNTSSIM